MYIDYRLKFDSEAEAKAVLYRIEEKEDYEMANYPAIDLIGTIYTPTGKMIDSDEGEVPEMTPVDGYHVNVRVLKEAPELETYRVFPVTPHRVWL